MDESKNLLSALEKMLTMKTAAVTTSVEPVPSTSTESGQSRKRPRETEEIAQVKKPRLDRTVRKSIGNTFSTIDIPVGTSRDLTVSLEQAKGDICEVIENELVGRKALEFYLTVNPELERISTEGEEVTSAPYLHSLPSVVLESSDLDEQYQTASDRLKDLLDVFQGEGSGFTLRSILGCTLNVATYDVIGGSSFIELPAYNKNKMACVNIKNDDDRCFLFCLSYVRNPPNSNVPNQPYHYKKDLVNFNVDGLKFPLPVKQIPKFENQNTDFSVNVYALDEIKTKSRDNKAILFPLYNTKERNRKYHANLLLITFGDKRHYVVIKSLSRLLRGRTTDEQINEASDCIKHLLDIHEGRGSGFSLDSILECHLNLATFDVIGGSSNPPLPKYIQSKNATVNIKSKDDKNFLYCLSYVRKPVAKHAQRASKYIKDLNNFDFFGIKFPVTLNQIEKFEQQNPDFSVNVFKLDKKKKIKLIPLYTTPERNRKYHANLLHTGNKQKPHYVVIKNMSRLLFDKTSDHNKLYVCKYCLTTFSKESGLEAHKC